MLSYLLYDESLLARVKKETENAWSSGELDVKYLCTNSPVLESVFFETMRCSTGAAALREMAEDTVIGNKIFRKGEKLLIPFRQLHSNEKIWGTTTNDFDPGRFQKKKSLARHSSFRPFGGGETLCPGRILAVEIMFGLIATLLHRFTAKLSGSSAETIADNALVDGKPPFPQLSKVPSIGVSGPLEGTDVLLDITPIFE